MAEDPIWWNALTAESRSGFGFFPPQKGLDLRIYAQKVLDRRACFSDRMVNRYLLAGLDNPPPVSERAGLISMPFLEMVDRLDLQQRPRDEESSGGPQLSSLGVSSRGL